MKLGFLKIIRIIVSLIFFIVTGFLFLSFSHFTQDFAGTILYLQFVPSLLKFIVQPSILTIGFVLIIIFNLLFGRIYCSSICPLGTLMDIFTYIRKKIKRKKFIYARPHNFIRNSILIITICSFLAGTVLLINLLDPYSNFGRITYNFFKPLYIYANNLISSIFESYDNYSITPLVFKGWRVEILFYPFLILGLIMWMSAFHGRLYCNTICPVGALLALFSKFSIFKIVIDNELCEACGLCEKECKAKCIDNKTKHLDFTRCIACFNCFRVCKLNGFKYEISNSFKLKKKRKFNIPESEFGNKSLFVIQNEAKDFVCNVHASFGRFFTSLRSVRNDISLLFRQFHKEINHIDYSKRSFLINFSTILFGIASYACSPIKSNNKQQAKIPENKKYEATPPGSLSIEHFTNTCTACHLCVSVCCNQVLQPALLEYGLTGIMQPRMDYHTGFCNYECNDCSMICPTGAILPIELEKKKLTQLGVARFIKNNCIVITNKSECGACSEHCPTKACNMIPYQNLHLPEVDKKICIGCGACEFACPAKPFKAIYVEGNPVHKIAEKPKIQKLEKIEKEIIDTLKESRERLKEKGFPF